MNKIAFIFKNGKFKEPILAKRVNEPEHSGICNGECQTFKTDIKVRRMNTQYADVDSNYVECCGECFEEIQEYWKERWEEYYSGRL